MNRLSYLYIVLSESSGKDAGDESTSDFYPIYRAAFSCAIKAGCPHVEEGSIHLLSLFGELFKIQKSDIIMDEILEKKPFHESIPATDHHPIYKKADSAPMLHDNSSDSTVHVKKASGKLHSKGLETLFLNPPETPAISPETIPSLHNSDTRDNDLFRDSHVICINSYDYDSNTKERELKKSEELCITVYPMEVKDTLLSAPITAVIDNGAAHSILTSMPGGQNSLVCEFGEYSFIIRGSFEEGEYITTVTPFNSTADTRLFDVIEKSVVKRRPENKKYIGHPVIEIGEYTEHIFPLSDKNTENSLCPFALVCVSGDTRDIYETSDLLNILLQHKDRKYEFLAGFTQDGKFDAGYHNIPQQ